MKVWIKVIGFFLVLGMNLPACHSSDVGSATTKTGRPGECKMKTYRMGRFAIDIPFEMKQVVQAQTIRHAEVQEFEWPQSTNREKDRMDQWNLRIKQINELEKPRGVKTNVIAECEFKLGKWAKGICYYGDYIIPNRHFWSVLVDYGKNGVWLTIDGADDQLSIVNLRNILTQIHYDSPSSRENFYLKYGFVNLPYLEQERTYARFEGHPLNLKLEVEMEETYDVQRLGIGARLAAAIATRYAPGVDVKEIRSRTRAAAGLKGEELVVKMSASGEESQVQFCWEYQGEEDSGEQPEIQITMETEDGNLDEKLNLWDSILDSFQPLYR